MARHIDTRFAQLITISSFVVSESLVGYAAAMLQLNEEKRRGRSAAKAVKAAFCKSAVPMHRVQIGKLFGAPCPCRTPKVCPNFVHVQRLS